MLAHYWAPGEDPRKPASRAVAMLLSSLAIAGQVSFTAKPTGIRDGDKVRINFAVSGLTDVEVAVLDAEGRVVRSLAAGVLEAKNPPPEPLKPGLAQELAWGGKDDWGKQTEGGPAS